MNFKSMYIFKRMLCTLFYQNISKKSTRNRNKPKIRQLFKVVGISPGGRNMPVVRYSPHSWGNRVSAMIELVRALSGDQPRLRRTLLGMRPGSGDEAQGFCISR